MADFIVDEEDIDENGQPIRYIILFVWKSKNASREESICTSVSILTDILYLRIICVLV